MKFPSINRTRKLNSAELEFVHDMYVELSASLVCCNVSASEGADTEFVSAAELLIREYRYQAKTHGVKAVNMTHAFGAFVSATLVPFVTLWQSASVQTGSQSYRSHKVFRENLREVYHACSAWRDKLENYL